MTVLPNPRHDPASTPNSASSEDAEKGACSVPAGAWNGAAEAPGEDSGQNRPVVGVPLLGVCAKGMEPGS